MMTEDEQDCVCRQIAVACMWGQSGIAGVILDLLDKQPDLAPHSWHEAYGLSAKLARRESVGTITDERILGNYLAMRYTLCNFDADGCSLFHPAPMGGLSQYVSKELADKFRASSAFG